MKLTGLILRCTIYKIHSPDKRVLSGGNKCESRNSRNSVLRKSNMTIKDRKGGEGGRRNTSLDDSHQ